MKKDNTYKKFYNIIYRWLTEGRYEDGISLFKSSEEDSFFPKYVMRMVREINDEMPVPMLEKIKTIETLSMGHVDYLNKFALRCAELYREKQEQKGHLIDIIKSDEELGLYDTNKSPWDVVSAYTTKDNITVINYRNGLTKVLL